MSENTVTESPLSVAKKAHRKAEYISQDYRLAQPKLEDAIKYLEKAGFDTTELKASLEEVKEKRDAARIERKKAAAVYYAAKAEDAAMQADMLADES